MSGNGRRETITGRKKDKIGGGRSIKRRSESEEGDFGFEVLDLTFELLFGFVGFVVAFFAGTGVVGVVIVLARETSHGDVIVVVVVIALGVHCATVPWHSI